MKKEKPQSAWELFRRLKNKFGGRLLYHINRHFRWPAWLNSADIIRSFIDETDEQEAIRILTIIKKELEE